MLSQTKTESQPINTIDPYNVKVTAQMLNVRTGVGTDKPIRTTIRKNTVCTIVDVRNGWGKLENGTGWIDLNYTKRI